MAESLWLRAPDCPLLQPEPDGVDPAALRGVQRLLEIGLAHQGSDDLARALLEEVNGALRADQAAVLEALPDWKVHWQHVRRGARPVSVALPRPLLGEILDREAGVSQPPRAGSSALLGACLSFTDRSNRVLLALRTREPFSRAELE